MVVDRSKCTACGTCTSACPHNVRTVMGKRMTVEDVMDTVCRDKNFYLHSGGGITVSGGDPVAQPGFSIELLKRCREEKIHTTIETCAFAPWEIFEQILEHTDLVYMDIKCIDPALHKRCTGVSNELILENARRASKLRPILFRTPVIPGFNDSPAELKQIARFVRDELKQERLELLKYNKLCQSKYIRLEREFQGDTDTGDDILEQQLNEYRSIVDPLF